MSCLYPPGFQVMDRTTVGVPWAVGRLGDVRALPVQDRDSRYQYHRGGTQRESELRPMIWQHMPSACLMSTVGDLSSSLLCANRERRNLPETLDGGPDTPTDRPCEVRPGLNLFSLVCTCIGDQANVKSPMACEPPGLVQASASVSSSRLFAGRPEFLTFSHGN